MQTFPLPAHTSSEWTEYFVGVDADPAVLNGDDYFLAVDDLQRRLLRAMPRRQLENVDKTMHKLASQPPLRLLAQVCYLSFSLYFRRTCS
jgi:hypothetical protein